jgi:hypothetical protein
MTSPELTARPGTRATRAPFWPRRGAGGEVRAGEEEALGVEFCGMFEPHLTSWRAQYDRMLRGFARLKQPYGSSVEYGDDLQHFLQDSWHLKDWIKNDKGSGIGTRIEDEVKGHPPLMVVADLANACKHLERKKPDRTGAYVTGNNLTVHLGQDRGIDLVHYVTMSDGQKVTAQKLIGEVIAAWDQILRSLGLIP